MVMRLIVSDIPEIDKLGLPKAVHNVLSKSGSGAGDGSDRFR